MRQPWFQMYAGDWRQCPELRACSLAARGLWIDMMCRAHQTEPYGHVVYESVEELALDVARPTAEVEAAFEELERRRVFTRARITDRGGDVFSRRMVRDEQRREQNRKNGQMGGNPSLRSGPRITDRISASGHGADIAQNQSQISESESESRDQKKRPSASARKRAPLDVGDVLGEFPDLNTPEVQTAVASYLEGRRERRQKPQTARGLRMGLGRLQPFGPSAAVEAIERAAQGGWLAFFEPRQTNGKPEESIDEMLAKIPRRK